MDILLLGKFSARIYQKFLEIISPKDNSRTSKLGASLVIKMKKTLRGIVKVIGTSPKDQHISNYANQPENSKEGKF